MKNETGVEFPGEYNELAYKEKTIRKLEIQLGKKDSRIDQLEKDKVIYLNRALRSEDAISKVRDSLNNLAAERGKLLRKLRRAESK